MTGRLEDVFCFGLGRICRYQKARLLAKGDSHIRRTSGKVQKKEGATRGLMIVYVYSGGKRIRDEFWTVDPSTNKRDQHVQELDVNVNAE